MKKIHRKFLGFTLITAITGFSLVTPAYAGAVHKVKSGESLWTIARQHNLDVETLARMNNIYNVNQIRIGMELKLEKTYKVKSGDSLWSIAKKFGVNYQTLVKYNNLRNPDRISVGMELKIPTSNSAGPKVQQQRFIWPIKGRISYFVPEMGGGTSFIPPFPSLPPLLSCVRRPPPRPRYTRPPLPSLPP